MALNKVVNFLELPLELRLQIYHYVCISDVSYPVVRHFADMYIDNGFVSIPLHNESAHKSVPWLPLALACKQTSMELRTYHDSPLRMGDDNVGRTYRLELQSACTELGSATWTRLPCRPAHAQYLEVDLCVNQDMLLWGDGGPMGITRALYQCLNLFIHCGPLLDSERPLKTPLRLTEVCITARRTTFADHDFAGYFRGPPLHSIIRQVVGAGPLAGFVDRVRVGSDPALPAVVKRQLYGTYDVPPVTYEVTAGREGERWTLPEEWERYGFEWGLDAYRTPQVRAAIRKLAASWSVDPARPP